SRESQALARTTRVAFVAPTGQKPAPRHRVPVVAASRLGEGLVIVMSRHALSGLGTDTRASTVPALGDLSATRAFLLSVARWTRRPAEWARIPPRGHRSTLRLIGAPRPPSPDSLTSAASPPLLEPPAGEAPVANLPTPVGTEPPRPPKAPEWS